MSKTVDPRTTPVYIEISGRLHKIHITMDTNRAYFIYDDMRLWYDPQRDGRLIEQEEAIKVFPEQFV